MSIFPQVPVFLSPHTTNTLKDGGKEEELDSTDHERVSAKMRLMMDDIEVRPMLSRVATTIQLQYSTLEYSFSAKRKLIYLAGYFLLNLSLTIYNKAVLGTLTIPWLLTALHATCSSVGCFVLCTNHVFNLTYLTAGEHLILLVFSSLFTLNIAMSNVSLALVSIPFHQIMRSTTPLFTILICKLFYSRTYSFSTYVSLLPLVAGIMLITYGDYYFTPLGFVVTLIGTILASVKTILTNRLMTGTIKLPALELLQRMSPLAALQSFTYAWATGEMSNFYAFLEAERVRRGSRYLWAIVAALLGNGLIAFLLNVSSLQANRLAGPLTMTVCGNVKQCLTIILGIVVFGIKVDLLNGIGIMLAVLGAAWYSSVELRTKGKTEYGVRSE